jgi:hypothetical protein
MTWEIALGIFALFSFVAGVVGVIVKVVVNNTKAMTELKCSISELNTRTENQGSDIDYVSSRVDDHEIRLIKLEGKV